MSDGVTRLDLDGDDAALDRALRELGPLMRRQELLDAAEPDVAFARDLRARLLDANIESDAPDPAFARGLRERLVGGSPQPVVAPPDTLPAPASDAPAPGVAPIPIDRPRRRRRAVVWLGLAAALVAALAAVVALNLPRALPQLRNMNNTTTVAGPPLPSLGDITRGYPDCGPNMQCGGGGGGGGGGVISPIASTVPFSTSPHSPYYGPLRITAAFPITGAATPPSYQLDAPPTAAQTAAMARRLGITARVTRVAGQDAMWNVAATGSGLPKATTPLHSLAVSTVTGEMIYHDLRYPIPSGPTRPQDRGRAVAAARAFLSRLGWQDVRARSAAPLEGGMQNGWIIETDWPGVDGATTPGATLTVVPGWHVSEARLWPLVARRTPVKARGTGAAFAPVQSGRVPLAVTENVPQAQARLANGGSATAKRVDVVEVLTADSDGRLYLVPAYRFSGSALLRPIRTVGVPYRRGLVPATWYALVPAG